MFIHAKFQVNKFQLFVVLHFWYNCDIRVRFYIETLFTHMDCVCKNEKLTPALRPKNDACKFNLLQLRLNQDRGSCVFRPFLFVFRLFSALFYQLMYYFSSFLNSHSHPCNIFFSHVLCKAGDKNQRANNGS